VSWYRTELENWLKTLIVKADYVIDWGGKQGRPVKDRVKSWDVKKYKIFDLPENDIEQLPFNLVEELADVIFCLEVFEYLIMPDVAMGNIAAYLKKGGRAYISARLVYPTHNELELDSLRYTEQGLRRLAQRAKLEVNNIWYREDKSGLLQSFYAADGMHPAKQYSHHVATGFIMELSN